MTSYLLLLCGIVLILSGNNKQICLVFIITTYYIVHSLNPVNCKSFQKNYI